jgi:polyribonucleotide nucleotidyltransferase
VSTFKIHKKEINWCGRKLTLETGRIARQADGAVLATYGETSVLCTVVAQKEATPDIDFLPLSVHYQEKYYAAGRIPGGFFKREGRPSEKETIVSRLIDRTIRPLFAPGFQNEVQVICTVLSHDLKNDPDIVAMIGASTALTISGIPFLGPIGSIRVGCVDGKFGFNLIPSEQTKSTLDLVVAGTSNGVLMVESEAQVLPEDVMLNAVMYGFEQFQPVIKAIIELAENCARTPWEIPKESTTLKDILKKLEKKFDESLRKAYSEVVKQERLNCISDLKQQAIKDLIGEGFDEKDIKRQFKVLEQNIVRGNLLKLKKRIDGRDLKTVRPIKAEVGTLPRAHGSSLFTRGETQALVVTTLGTGQDEQIVDALEGEHRQNFMLHYNFPPYSVGETGRVGVHGRREIGHGKLAWRALRPLLPNKEDFPYTIRIVSEITESNGSSSMATVCGGSLSLMDAGVPLKQPVAGIAMGLIKENDQYIILSDILGDEDHLGDMDLKVAGTHEGVTALQMDIKITGISKEIMASALHQAREGRLHILTEMNKSIRQSREAVSKNAPQIKTISIPKEKIGQVIGPGGSVIRELYESTGSKIDIQEDGQVTISSVDGHAIEEAIRRIQDIVAEPEVGKVYQGRVVKSLEFGAFVKFLGQRDGLVHISELADHRVQNVEDIVKVDDKVYVKVIGFDRGKVRLSMKAVDQETGRAFA